MEYQNMEYQNMEYQNIKIWNIKIWNIKIWYIKMITSRNDKNIRCVQSFAQGIFTHSKEKNRNRFLIKKISEKIYSFWVRVFKF